MFRRTSALIGIGLCFLPATAGAKKAPLKSDNIWQQRIASLRVQGPEGLAKALDAYDELQRQTEELQEASNGLNAAGHKGSERSAAEIERKMAALNRQLDKLRVAIDQIGGQRSCTVSRLYWYTDLSAAKAEAARTGRPILSLRMLGNLTDEFSCANSRFFRTALYSNKDISDYLRDHFVLHWQSVRPVPRVTIDFGDGRKLERTLTGNSAHYVLTSDGTPLDVLPGLYSPQAFHEWLSRVRKLHGHYAAAPTSERAAMLQNYHRGQKDAVLQSWDLDIQRLGARQVELVSARIAGAVETAQMAGEPAAEPAPHAVAAEKRAVGKRLTVEPIYRFANLGGRWMEQGMDDNLWRSIANLHRDEVKLDAASVAVMQGEFPNARVAGQLAGGKGKIENPILRLVVAFQDSIGQDTIRNEYLLHRRIHEAFAAGEIQTASADTLNEWVYAELFLTPSSDPWLGLAPPDVYTALEGDGRIEATAALLKRPGG